MNVMMKVVWWKFTKPRVPLVHHGRHMINTTLREQKVRLVKIYFNEMFLQFRSSRCIRQVFINTTFGYFELAPKTQLCLYWIETFQFKALMGRKYFFPLFLSVCACDYLLFITLPLDASTYLSSHNSLVVILTHLYTSTFKA